jgi:tetratricopeptide (TPR) repeat protein
VPRKIASGKRDLFPEKDQKAEQISPRYSARRVKTIFWYRSILYFCARADCSGMERIEKTVFLSYRRTNIPWALAIFQSLVQHGYDVFFDYNGIASGDFERVILENITARAHFLVLLTPSALERCNEPSDWLRREIETALANQRNTIPLMLEGFDFGTPKIASQLTGRLSALKHYNGLSIPPEYFLEAMGRLRDRYLNVPLSAVLHPISLSGQLAATEQRTAAEAAQSVQEKELTAQQWFERGFAAVETDEMLRFYSEAIRLKPNYAYAFNNRGNARYDKGDLDGALQDYNEAIRLDASNTYAFSGRGNVRYDKGDLDGALQDYNEAIRLDASKTYAFSGRGNVRCDKGDLDGALQDYNEAIRLDASNTYAFSGRGNVRCDKGDLDGALQDYNEAIRLDASKTYAFNGRGNVRYDKGDLDGALQDYNEAIRLDASKTHAFNGRGNVRYDKGDLDGALQDYNEAIRLDASNTYGFSGRGNVRYDKGDLDGALQDYNEAIRLNASNAYAFSGRGNVRRAKGDLDGEIKDYDEALRLKAVAGAERPTK